MGHDKHRAAAKDLKVPVVVLVLSTSRHSRSDRSGPLLAKLLEGAGHGVHARDILPDDQGVIVQRLKAIAAEGKARAVILSGGTGLSRNDGTIEAVQRLMDKEIVGFGELFRMLSYEQIGAPAMLSRATAGIMGNLIVFAIPGSPNACQLAMEKLILPELAHIVYELGKEGPAALVEKQPAPVEEATPAAEEPEEGGVEFKGERVGDERYGVRIENGTYGLEAPEAAEGGAWREALDALGGSAPDLSERVRLPESLAKLPAVLEVLNSAGEQGVVDFEGERYAVFGFPDLRRPGAKVIAVGEGADHGEVVALHRWPGKAGVLRRGGGRLMSRGRLSATALELTGAEYPGEGHLLAVDGKTVFVATQGRVVSWNGQRATMEGPVGSVLATLLLRWSQR
ncbi:MAG: MogA/MoaB family molybdenum cofactor biosynthesis protein [Alphaproteobacteria bacterium]|nr:MogA/MoaB family molybdenum cofactor biosynthesis protein [Alphaproteobacteria bacterium]